ncbi:MAG: PIN domain-containing protein [Halobacteria archaeon]|nr:PIN domain-containing protein [Halobacteria archaeon]
MIFALDTNVLFDVLFEDESYHEESKQVLETASERGFFVISPEVYSELVTGFDIRFSNPQQETDTFLEEKNIKLKSHTKKSLALAGQKWSEYDSSEDVQCPNCGHVNRYECENCGETVSWRNHLITDFLIGGHAEEIADRLITRDRGYYETYFDINVYYS